jgi:hypothetical protein
MDKDEGQTMDTREWDAYIASAPNLVTAIERFEEAVQAGVDVGELLELQSKRA